MGRVLLRRVGLRPTLREMGIRYVMGRGPTIKEEPVQRMCLPASIWVAALNLPEYSGPNRMSASSIADDTQCGRAFPCLGNMSLLRQYLRHWSLGASGTTRVKLSKSPPISETPRTYGVVGEL